MMGFEKTVQRLRAREARVLARRDRLHTNAQSFQNKVRCEGAFARVAQGWEVMGGLRDCEGLGEV